MAPLVKLVDDAVSVHPGAVGRLSLTCMVPSAPLVDWLVPLSATPGSVELVGAGTSWSAPVNVTFSGR